MFHLVSLHLNSLSPDLADATRIQVDTAWRDDLKLAGLGWTMLKKG